MTDDLEALKVKLQEEISGGLRRDIPIHIVAQRAANICGDALTDALAEVKRLRSALVDAIDDLQATLRFDNGWECSEEVLLGRYRAALTQQPQAGGGE